MHPALAANQQRQYEARTALLAGWKDLSPAQKELLAVLPMHGFKAEAARAVGKSPKWLENQERNHPQFREAVRKVLSREWTPRLIAQALATDLLPLSMLKPESTEGRPWGQPLKKPAGAPLNLG